MRVKKGFYNDATYRRHKVVQRVVAFCNATVAECVANGDVLRGRVAHQLKCLVIKRYSRSKSPDDASFRPLCPDWERDPASALDWLVAARSESPRRMDLIEGAKEYGPKTIQLWYKNLGIK